MIQYIYSGKPAPSKNAGIFFYTPQTDSTMNAAALLSQVYPERLLGIRADYQAAGRGRFSDRTWNSQPGKNLLCTYSIPMGSSGVPVQLMPLLAGAAVSSVVELLGMPGKITVKWPNDVLVDDKKLCGILCEMRSGVVFAGIGLNVNQEEFPDMGARGATSLILETGRKHDLDSLHASLLDAVLQNMGDESWLEGFSGKLYGIGKRLRFSSGVPGNERILTGILAGIGTDGALVLRTKKGTEHLYTGEIIGEPMSAG